MQHSKNSKSATKKRKISLCFFDSELKVEINKLIDSLCESNFDMKKAMIIILKSRRNSKLFSEEQAEKIVNSETDKLYNMLGNQLIKMMKEYKEITAEMLLFNLYAIMSRLEEQENSRANSQDYINSLSTNAKKNGLEE